MSEFLIPHNDEGRALSPIEAKTGVVLPIWAPGDGLTNRHHPHFYKRNFLNGLRKQETRAVRFSRLQRVQLSAHEKYHRAFDGTAFPVDENQSFGITILNCAGYIAGHSVEMSGSKPNIIETTPRMRRILRSPGILTMERRYSYRRDIGQFLMYHAVSQRFDHVKRGQVEEFIELGAAKFQTDELAQERRLRLGMRLTNIGLGIAVDGIGKKYLQARQSLALPEEAPICAWQVAKDYVAGHEPDYYDTLHENLELQLADAA
ncbi:hypothetical protein H0X10_00895 [Candidatus Saccharibacteria bacterium]|nr:hypothetical protein [Candidatus Saccharibacteria bacterium]